MATTQIRGNTQILNGSITSAQVNASIIIAAGTNPFTADQPMGGFKLTGLATPTNAQDAANKAYVDAAAQGLDVKASVRAATTANLTLTAPQTIDGVALIAGDRVLVKNQTAAQDNGIYTVAAGAWQRATDADVSAEVSSGMFTFVEEGTTQASTGWILTTPNPITLGTTPLNFVQFSQAGTIGAGMGLTKTGAVIDVVGGDGLVVAADLVSANIDGTTLSFDASSPKKIQVAAGGIGATHLAAAVAGNGLTGGAGSPLAVVGGDGLIVAADLVSANIDTNAGLKFDASSPKKMQVALNGTSLLVSASGLSVNPAKTITRETPTGLMNGTNTAFTLASAPIAGSEEVFLNGLLQEPGAGNDYTISGVTITYLVAPAATDRLRVSYRIA